TWTYTVADSAVEYLAKDQTKVESFTITLDDGNGGLITKQIDVTITGTNDQTLLTSVNSTAISTTVAESAGNSSAQDIAAINGSLAFSDVDIGDSLAASAGSPTVALNGGALPAGVDAASLTAALNHLSFGVSVVSNGEATQNISWTWDPTAANLDFLKAGDQLTVTYAIHVADSVPQNLTFTITGTNDQTLLTSVNSTAVSTTVAESAGNSSAQDIAAIHGALAITDVDIGDGLNGFAGSPTVALNGGALPAGVNAAALTAALDHLSFNFGVGIFSTGGATQMSWTWDPTAANLDFLKAGDQLTVTYAVHVADSAPQNLTFTITGTNDGPTLAPIANQTYTDTAADDTFAPISGTLSSQDPDAGDTKVYSISSGIPEAHTVNGVDYDIIKPSFYGPLYLNSQTGAYTFVPDDSRLESQKTSESLFFEFTVTDGSGASATQTLTINIDGVNDTPTLAAVTGPTYNDTAGADTFSASSGTLFGSDRDLDTLSYGINSGMTGGSTIIGGVTYDVSKVGSFGTLYVNSSTGQYTYQENNSAINAATTATSDNFTVTTSDGTASASTALNVTINGVNDAPIGVNDTGSATEKGGTANASGGANATGNVITNDTDVDSAGLTVSAIRTGGTEGAGMAGTVGSGLVGAHGTLTLQSNGSYTYVVNENDATVQALNTGGSTTDSFNYTVSDGSLTDTAVLTVTINGANDAPVNTVPGTQTTNEDTAKVFSSANGNQISIFDPDNTTHTVTLSVPNGAITLNGTSGLSFTVGDGTADGTMTFSGTDANINAALNGLSFLANPNFNGAAAIQIITSDGALSDTDSVVVIINAVNDAPVNTVPGAQTTNVNVSKAITGLNISDVDAGTASMTVTLAVTHGTLTVSGGSAAISGNGTGTVTLTGSQTAIDSTLGATVTYVPTNNFVGSATLTMTTSDNGNSGSGGTLTDTDVVSISVVSPSSSTLTTGTDTVFFASGTNTITGTNTTATNGDVITGGTGTDTLTIDTAKNITQTYTFGDGAHSDIGLTNFETLQFIRSDTTGSDPTITAVFDSSFNNNGTLTVDGSALTGSHAAGFTVDASAVTSGSFVIVGSAQADTLKGGAGSDTISGGNGVDRIVGNGGADTLTGGAGNDTFAYLATGDAGDHITDFNTSGDKLEFTVTASRFAIGDLDTNVENVKSGNNSTINVANTEVGIKTDASVTTATVQSTIDGYTNITTGALFVFFNSTVGHAQVYYDANPAAAGGAILVADLDNLTTLASITAFNAADFAFGTALAPAGVAGEAINLALTAPAEFQGQTATVTITNVPDGWVLNGGTQQADGSWKVTTADISKLTVTSPVEHVGALHLDVTVDFVQADGSTATLRFADNVEAYAPGSPIFAWSGDDVLTASSGNDLFVFSQPIGNDTVHSFDATADKVDLIGYSGFQSFADVQAHTADDASGNAVITLGDGQSITLEGVHSSALSAGNFVFDQTPVVNNAGTMTIGDGALLPLSGTVNNSGLISLDSTGSDTLLQLIQHGITLQGGGQIVLSDSDANVISGTAADVTLTNIDNIISGAGQLGGGLLGLNNQGTIIATGTHALVIDTGGSTVANSGTLEATGSGGLTITGTLANSGLIWANGGNITINGQVTGEGDAIVGNLSKVEFHAASSAHVIFGTDAAGTLRLDDSFDFSGSIAGITNDDKVDLGDIWYGTGTSAVYEANQDGRGGTLTVSDGTHDATLHIIGTYDADSFTVADDGTGRTVVGYHPADEFHFV
ncbi:beta strand repeat-containing protein, partial [Mesorhizobium sp. 2RAF45]|uniref:beta strand repeat-containing protein n=1 Tax=Mesorhizobium sp. 2RAF45 TaxID=3233001 RepID=UPI003F96B47B